MINDGVEVLIKEHKSLTEMVEHFGRKIVELEAERDALKELNGALIQTLEDIQSMNDGSIWEQNNTVIYMAQFARQAINKAREVTNG